MLQKYLMGVDIGTYSSKGVLVAEDGSVLASQVVEHPLLMPRPGFMEHDPETTWWADFIAISRGLLREAGIPSNQVAALGISTISPGIVMVGPEGRALRPAILYGIDTRAAREAQELQALSGVSQDAQSGSPKIMWVRRNEPEIWRRTRLILNGSGYLVYRLTGEATMDYYNAGIFAPFFDMQSFTWDARWSEVVAPLELMPHLTWSCEVAGRISREAGLETGLAVGTPVITGTDDACAEAIGAGLSAVGDLLIMYGSSTFFVLKTRHLTNSRRFWCVPFLEPGTFCATGGTATAGSLTRWFRDQFALPELEAETSGGENAYAVLARLAAGSPPGANGLVALPYFSGERTPIHDPHASGLIMGLNLKHTRADVYRALLEGVGYSIRHNLEAMKEEGMEIQRLLAVGGGALNLPWMQMVSDIAGITQVIPQQQGGASYGDAFLAGVGNGLFASTGDARRWVKPGKVIQPEEYSSRIYEPLYRIYRDLYQVNAPLMSRLSHIAQVERDYT